jgi:N-methylhydantoinase A/oxoprolinase/acetone carboxylase beta subunit
VRFAAGVDIGGTFTDFVVYDYKAHRILTEKVLTTPENPADAVIQGFTLLQSKQGVELREMQRILHATTLATNAVIERRGARTGLLTTSGFEDLLDIRKGMRYDQYDLKIQVPKAYVPRFLRRGVSERMLASGRELRALSASEVIENVGQLVAEGVDSLAVSFLHSYANPAHERMAKDIVSKNFPNLSISISSEVTTQVREYERTSTTVVDAYVKPVINGYLDQLERRLTTELGFVGNILIMTCSGGVVNPMVARSRPVLLLESGPAAGVSISSNIAKHLRLQGAFSFDMGGTTAKGSILGKNGRVEKGYEFEAARVNKFRRGSGIPISIPTVKLIEIGSGGGSIAFADDLGSVRVGPRSAGAKPGPACYGLGGREPTVTDSDLILGYLDPDYFLAGAMKLDIELARSAIENSISKKMQLSIEEAAWAVHERVNEDIATAFRLHSSEMGVDYRNHALISFGGAGPVHATRIARKLLVRTVIIPPRAGVLSAEGLLVSPLSIDIAQATRHEIADLSYERYNELFEEVVQRGSTILLSSGVRRADLKIMRSLDMCYHGQGYDVPVDLRGPRATHDEFSDLKRLFEVAYKAKYSISRLSNAIEITSFRATISSKTGEGVMSDAIQEEGFGNKQRRRRSAKTAYDSQSMKFRKFQVVDRYSLKKGDHIEGPALVQEAESTTVLSSNCKGTVDDMNNLVITVGTKE